MIAIVRTDSTDKDFIRLVQSLDQDLAVKDGDMHTFFKQFNKIDRIRHALVAKAGATAVACGALKEYDQQTAEIKRMFVLPGYRCQGIATRMVAELEHWAKELGYTNCILETGKKMTDAISVYQKAGYSVTPNYGQYFGVDLSVCMRKFL